jgi:SAM-dependent methyltransferase
MLLPDPGPALSTYEALADVYDAFSADFGHERWLTTIRAVAAEHGLRGRRVLDVGCGTGRSFAPLVTEGFTVSACDLSPAMVRHAAAKTDQPHRVFAADMRTLPDVGPFDLVTCLDDAVNYLLDDAGLVQAFRSVARVLAPGGLFAFDANTALTYATAFRSDDVFAAGGHAFAWSGLGPAAGCHEAALRITTADGAQITAVHRQRHVAPDRIVALLAAARLECRAVLSQRTGCRVARDGDPRATKALYMAAPASPTTRKEAS